MVFTILRQHAQNTAISVRLKMPPYIQRIKKRECPVDIAAFATMELDGYPYYLWRFRRRRPLRAKKIKPQSRFKTLASILQRLFISGLTRSRYIRRGSPERRAFQGLFHFRASAQKVSKFKSESRILPRILLFPRGFPSFPGILRSQTRLSNIAECGRFSRLSEAE